MQVPKPIEVLDGKCEGGKEPMNEEAVRMTIVDVFEAALRGLMLCVARFRTPHCHRQE
jgi:hypothetical protein